jgi:hypothetical protein
MSLYAKYEQIGIAINQTEVTQSKSIIFGNFKSNIFINIIANKYNNEPINVYQTLINMR